MWCSRAPVVLAVVAAMTSCGGEEAPVPSADLEVEAEAALREASLTLVPPNCGGVVISAGFGLTAAHCIAEGETTRAAVLSTGEVVPVLVEVDRPRDIALLAFDEPVDVTPLDVADTMPNIGDLLFFLGRADDEDAALQTAQVLDIGACPTIPGVDNAIFTDLEAIPGDSGTPLLNEDLEVVGLVHGGAECEIAAPVSGLEVE